MKKPMYKLLATRIALGLFGLVAFGSSAMAYQSYSNPPKVVVEGNYIEATTAPQPVIQDAQPTDGGQKLGASGDPSNILGPILCVNNNCTYSVVASFIDASTTILSIADPYLKVTSTPTDVVIYRDDSGLQYTGATTTVDLVRLDVTGAATTTFQVACGAAATPIAAPSPKIVSSTTAINTSTTGVVENNITAAQGAMVDGGTVAKIMLTPATPYLVCNVTPNVSAGFTNTGNTFDGKATVQFKRSK